MEPESPNNNEDDNLNGQAQQSNMEKLTKMYESKTYENLKNGLQKKDYKLNDLLDCNEHELRQELDTHKVTGIDQNKFVKAVKATRKWQEQHSQSQSQSQSNEKTKEKKIQLGLPNYRVEFDEKNVKASKEDKSKANKQNENIGNATFNFLYEVVTGDGLFYQQLESKDFDVKTTYKPEILFERNGIPNPNALIRRSSSEKAMMRHLATRKKIKDDGISTRNIDLFSTIACSGSGKTTIAHELMTNSMYHNILTSEKDYRKMLEDNVDSKDDSKEDSEDDERRRWQINDHDKTVQPIRIALTYGDGGNKKIPEIHDKPTPCHAWLLLLSLLHWKIPTFNGKNMIQYLQKIIDTVADWEELTIPIAMRLIYRHKGINPLSPIIIVIDELMELEGTITAALSAKKKGGNNDNSGSGSLSRSPSRSPSRSRSRSGSGENSNSNPIVYSHSPSAPKWSSRNRTYVTAAVKKLDKERDYTLLSGLYDLLHSIGNFYHDYSDEFPVVLYFITSLFNSEFGNKTVSGRSLFKVPLDLFTFAEMEELLSRPENALSTILRDKNNKNNIIAYSYIAFLLDLCMGYPSQFAAINRYFNSKNRKENENRLKKLHTSPLVCLSDVETEMKNDATSRVDSFVKFWKDYGLPSMIALLGIPLNNEESLDYIRTSENKKIRMEDLCIRAMFKPKGNRLIFPPLFLGCIEERLGNVQTEIAVKAICLIPEQGRELSGKPFEERCYHLEILKSRYYKQKQRNIDGTVYIGYEGLFADYLGGFIDSGNDFVNLILAQKVFIPAIDGVIRLINNEKDGVDLQHLSCDALDKTKIYAPDDSTFPGIDYFSAIYIIDIKSWLFLGRQAKQAVKNLTSMQQEQLNQYSASLEKLIFGKSKKSKKSKNKKNKKGKKSKVKIAKNELFLCLFLSPKKMVSRWHPSKKIEKQMLWMDETHLSRFFGPQFDLTLSWTLKTAGQQKLQVSRQSTEPRTFVFGNGGVVDISVVSLFENNKNENKNKNKDKIKTNENNNSDDKDNNENEENDSDEGEIEDIDVTLTQSATMISAEAETSETDLHSDDGGEAPKKRRKLNSGAVAQQ